MRLLLWSHLFLLLVSIVSISDCFRLYKPGYSLGYRHMIVLVSFEHFCNFSFVFSLESPVRGSFCHDLTIVFGSESHISF